MHTNKIKRFAAMAAAITVLAFSLSGCSGKSYKGAEDPNADTSSETGDGSSAVSDNNGGSQTDDKQPNASDKVKDKDLDASYDAPDAVITLGGDGINIQGSGAEYKDGEIVISKKGVYVFSGALSDGRIVVDATEKADVKIVLNDADITSSDGCAIYAKLADKVIITLAEGSINSLTDAQKYSDSGEGAPTACVYADCDLTINGSGSLTVKGNSNNGIVSKDDLVLVGGSVAVESANNGIKGKDSITVCGGEYIVNSGGDGIKSDNSNNAKKGWIVINGGSLDLASGGDGIQAQTSLTVTDGAVNIRTQSGKGDDSAKKGMKSGGDMYISGGSFTLDTEETCVKSSGELTIDDGSFSCSASDGNGFSAAGNVTVNGGEIDITKSKEGIESKAVMTINGGDISIKASDDGLNAGNSSDNKQASHEIFINGGYVYIEADGDGIDSNGDITMTGGTVIVAGPMDNRNGALDCGDWGNSITVSGGTLVAAGSTGMMEAPDGEGSQYSIYTTMLNAQQGDTVTLADEGGNVIVSVTLPKQAQGIVISSPAIESGKSYSLYKGGELSAQSESDAHGVVLEGSISGGELVASGEITEMTTSFGGELGHGGFGGDKGGGKPGGDKPDKQMPGGEMPQRPDGDAPDTMMPDGDKPVMEFPNGEMPQDGDFSRGEKPDLMRNA